MKTTKTVLFVLLLAGWVGGCGDDAGNRERIRALPLDQVEVAGGFWGDRLETSRAVTVPYAFERCAEAGLIDNFAIAGGLKAGKQSGVYPFDDTDVYKTIEGAAYLLNTGSAPQLDHYLDSLITLIAAAQEPDGYLYTARRNRPEWLARRSGETRWSKLSASHELYNAGHLYEAAVAHYQATGKRTLLEVALKNADLICETFGPHGIHSPPGHQEIEIGLAKLFRVTGERKYLDAALFFLDQRGYPGDGRASWGEYAQDHLPVLQQNEAVGHAVRLAYMGSALEEVGVLSGDRRYADASERLWENVVGKKFYITGGLGSVGIGERFAGNYDLPNKSAYQETCTAIANVFWNQRLFLATGDARYLDVLERSLFNTLLAGVSLEGNRFFYPNVLASSGHHERSAWFSCNCCITNMSRFMPSLGQYLYAIDEGQQIYVSQYAGSRARIMLGENEVKLVQQTKYPWDGDVKLTVNPAQPAEFEIYLRIPGWAHNQPLPSDLYHFLYPAKDAVTLTVNDQPVPVELNKGFALIRRRWNPGDRVQLTLPMPVRRVAAHEQVAADRGRVALQRGPLVYCLEWPDVADGRVSDLYLPDDAPLAADVRPELLGGVTVISGSGQQVRMEGETPVAAGEKAFVAIPYYAWAHRGKGEMTVWIADNPAAALPADAPPIARQSRSSSSGGENLSALNDGAVPGGADAEAPYFSWPAGGDTVWVQYDFPEMQEVSEVRVRWLADQAPQGYRVPRSWRILADIDGRWEQVYNPSRTWGTDLEQINSVIFETVRTPSLRLEARLRSGFGAAIREWEVY